MELNEALNQIQAIRVQVARTEVFRGYKAGTVACTGLVAFLAAAVQPALVPDPLANIGSYLQLWIVVAAVSVAMVATELVARGMTESPFRQAQTWRAVEQFVPCLLAGAGMTWALVRFSPDGAHQLPGLWSIVFSLGVFASWRQLPPAAIAVAAYYLAAGIACLAIARDEQALGPCAMAATFGNGQLLTAAVLYFGLERKHGDE